MLVLVVFNLLKGFDVEEATLSLLAAALLWWGRPAFDALPREIHPRPSWLGALLALSIALAFSALLVEVAAPGEASTLAVLRELGDLMLWQRGPVHFPDELSRLPLAVGLLSLLGLLSGLWLLFRPLVLPRELPDADSRALAQALVKAHGHDTLAYFKLRRDKHYLFSTDGHAFLGYRVENGVLLVSGDPVGDEGAITELVATALSFAGRHGLAFGVVGASAPLLDLYRRTGLKAIYIGDEAVLELGSFSLEGRAIRKVRQSVSRLEKAGYKTVLSPYSALTESELTELEQISLAWLKGEDERGFSMAMDSLRGESQAESLLVVARDREGKARGFLHFVPAYGRQAYSLSFMRSDPDTPNGLMEYLVSAAAQSLREQGVEELSLNFAAFARFFRAPEGPGERLLARLFRLGERLFQIERLFHFNAKFFPRWDPRYLIFESVLSLPRLSLAVMWAEGQLPRPPIGLSRARPAERLGAEPRGHAL
jgi:lysyl-tRNA synthetase class 2